MDPFSPSLNVAGTLMLDPFKPSFIASPVIWQTTLVLTDCFGWGGASIWGVLRWTHFFTLIGAHVGGTVVQDPFFHLHLTSHRPQLGKQPLFDRFF